AYSAPEQIQGKSRPASDQYSLGIVVYEWLSGERPFHGSFTELVGQHLTVPPPSLREKVPMLSPTLVEVVMRALAKDPHQRFSTIHAFALALEQASWGTLPTERGHSIPPATPPMFQPPGPYGTFSTQANQQVPVSMMQAPPYFPIPPR